MSSFYKMFDRRGRSRRLRKVLTTTLCVAVGIVIAGTMAGLFTQTSAETLAVAPIDQTPSTSAATALTNSGAPSANSAEVSHPHAVASCDDFEFAFLNAACSKVRVKHIGKRPKGPRWSVARR
jgi:hypothetical protein